jgi:hypothetical protein
MTGIPLSRIGNTCEIDRPAPIHQKRTSERSGIMPPKKMDNKRDSLLSILPLILDTKRVFVRVTTQYIVLILYPTKIWTYGYILHSALMLRSILGSIPWTRILLPCNLV